MPHASPSDMAVPASQMTVLNCRPPCLVREIRTLEAHAAASYFGGAWRITPVLWPKADLRQIPDDWRTVASRLSPPPSGGPRLAITPVNAILNYCFALLESEIRLALADQLQRITRDRIADLLGVPRGRPGSPKWRLASLSSWTARKCYTSVFATGAIRGSARAYNLG